MAFLIKVQMLMVRSAAFCIPWIHQNVAYFAKICTSHILWHAIAFQNSHRYKYAKICISLHISTYVTKCSLHLLKCTSYQNRLLYMVHFCFHDHHWFVASSLHIPILQAYRYRMQMCRPNMHPNSGIFMAYTCAYRKYVTYTHICHISAAYYV